MKLIKLKNIISDLDNKIIHDIQIDKSLLVIKNKEEISEFEKHHIIPTWFEIIPHLTIKWTIKFIKKESLNYCEICKIKIIFFIEKYTKNIRWEKHNLVVLHAMKLTK